MRVMRERPDGARACRKDDVDETSGPGGRWAECADLQEEGGLSGRFAQFFDQCDIAADEDSRADVEQGIEDLMERATYGELYLRRGLRAAAEVVVMQVRKEVYELILGKFMIGGKAYHLRLYFTEPVDEPDVLLALSVEWKQDGWPEGRDEQDEHARQAFERFKRHCRT